MPQTSWQGMDGLEETYRGTGGSRADGRDEAAYGLACPGSRRVRETLRGERGAAVAGGSGGVTDDSSGSSASSSDGVGRTGNYYCCVFPLNLFFIRF